MRKRKPSLAQYLNSETFNDYYERLRRICLSIFEWSNIPSSMDSRFLELCLFTNGRAAILKSEKFGFINTRVASNGYLNIYGKPTSINCYSYEFQENRELYQGFKNENDKEDKAILVYNNWDGTPTDTSIQLFASRLADAQRTCDVNVLQQKRPYMVLTSESQLISIKEALKKIEDNEVAIIGDRNALTPDAIRVLETEAPFVADKIMLYKQRIWNEFLTFIGVNNLEGKKERYLEEEIDSNNEVINMNLQAQLAMRKEACNQFNKYFGKNIEVKVRSDLYNMVKQTESIITDLNTDLLKEKVEKEVENE